MDAHTSSTSSAQRLPRWLRVAFFVALITLAQSGVAFLLTWVEPSRDTLTRVIDLSHGHTAFAPDAWLAGHEARSDATKPAATRKDAKATLDEIARGGPNQPTILIVRAPGVVSESGHLVLLSPDATDVSTSLRLRNVLKSLQASTSKQKLLVLDLAPPMASAWRGYVHHDLGAAIARELDAVPDSDRLVLATCGPGQTPHGSPDFGTSIFTHYVDEGLRGHADGYGDHRDGRITVRELAAFVQARVARWTLHNRDERQTPTLLGDGGDFVVASVDPNAGPETSPNLIAREYPEGLQRMWKERDNRFLTGPYRLAARRFQTRQAWLQFVSRNDAAPVMAANLKWTRPPSGKAIERVKLHDAMNAAKETTAQGAKVAFEEKWRALQQQLVDARPADVERIKNRFVEQVRTRTPEAELDAVVFAHAANDPQLDPATLRLYDQLLHSGTEALPRTAEALRLRQAADLTTRIDAFAGSDDVLEVFLRCTELGEKSQRQFPYIPGYVTLLDEPAQARHNGEIRLLSRGYANPKDARRELNQATKQFAELIALNERWRACEQALDEAMMELPWYAGALEALPELRETWRIATEHAATVANALEKQQEEGDWWFRVGRVRTQIEEASGAVAQLKQQQDILHAPFARDALARLERQCRAADADAGTLRQAEALLSVAAPILQADQRLSLRKAANALSRRLCEDILAKDRQDNETHRITPSAVADKGEPTDVARNAEWRARGHIALLELGGVPTKSIRAGLEHAIASPSDTSAWGAVGASCEQAWSKDAPARYDVDKSWRRRERLAWLMSPAQSTSADDAALSPVAESRLHELERRSLWVAAQNRYRALAFQTLNLETAGVVAARDFYRHRADKGGADDAALAFHVIGSVAPLTEADPQRRIEMELMRPAPPQVDLQVQVADDAWLDATSDLAALPVLTQTTATQKIAISVKRRVKAERSGMPPPLGFLLEARSNGRTWHHVVKTPIVPNTQLVQLLVSTDSDEPVSPVHDIRIRPGKVKQPHYFYVKNLTNRAQKVHVEIRAGATALCKGQDAIVLEPDSQRKVKFDDANATSIQGPLTVRVLDENRQKVLLERTLNVSMLQPSQYVRVAEAMYNPGAGGSNKWAIHVQAARPVSGPAIAAQLVLPVQRIPGLLGVGGGTLHADVPAQAQSSRVLFAENLRLIGAVQEEGPVYLHIDGVPRAFVFSTRFRRIGEPVQAVPDDRPAVRLGAPPCVMAGINCLVDIEVDNAPAGSKLEVALGRAGGKIGFEAELVREFTQPKNARIDVEATRDALVFNGTITDWTATFDTRAVVGARDLQARLIAPGGKVIAESRQPIVIDASPPVARIAPTPAQAKKGSILQVRAEGADPESGVAKVTFFYGRPEKGEVPPNAPRFKAVPATRDQSHWMAALLVPADHKGPLPISVQVVNHAGLASIDTVVVDITDREPGKNGTGEIRGKVKEGPRPQPNLLVTLTDEKGKELARTRTLADGSYVFTQLAPGRYCVVCVKPESQRRAVMNVTVEPDRTTPSDLSLSL